MSETNKLQHKNHAPIVILAVENLTTGIKFIPSKFPTLPQYIQHEKEHITLELPTQLGAVGHQLSLILHVVNVPTQPTLPVTAKILKVDPMEDKKFRFEVKLQQFDLHIWEKFQFYCEKRQKHISNLFESLKGRAS